MKNNEGLEQVEIGNLRKYVGITSKIITTLAVIWFLFQIYYSSIGILEAVKFRVWFFMFLGIMVFLFYPIVKREKKAERKIPPIYDLFFIMGVLTASGYFLITYDDLVMVRGGVHLPLDYWFGALGILIVFEMARRTVGSVMTILSAMFLLYTSFGNYIPGIFGHAGFSIKRVIDIMWWSTDGVFGIVIGVASTYIFLFILFGSFLRASGFIDFISKFALVLTGRSAGGSAKVAVVGSALMGMINGSGVANASAVGTVTIPMMKKTGYKSHYAAGVEAVASTGGVIAPPIMGAAAFVMAEYINVPYKTIMIAAIIPASLYFLMCFMSVHFEAKKMGLKGISKENLPNAFKVLKEGGHLLIPLFLLVFLLLTNRTPIYAAVWSLIAMVVVSWFRKETRLGWKEIIKAIEDGVKGVLIVSTACTIVGIIIATLSLTSLGLVLGNNILSIAGDSLLLVAVLTMLISIILGMGVPVTASYIITVTISAPLLISMDIPIIVAHMFAFFFAALSDITPPVALASLTTAGIAGANFWRVALTACRLGIVGFIIPFFFLYNPALLFVDSTIFESLLGWLTAAVGVIALAGVFSRWFLSDLNIIPSIILLMGGLLMISPGYITDLVGLLVTIIIAILQIVMKKQSIKENTARKVI